MLSKNYINEDNYVDEQNDFHKSRKPIKKINIIKKPVINVIV
jgi:hypothetical protein